MKPESSLSWSQELAIIGRYNILSQWSIYLWSTLKLSFHLRPGIQSCCFRLGVFGQISWYNFHDSPRVWHVPLFDLVVLMRDFRFSWWIIIHVDSSFGYLYRLIVVCVAGFSEEHASSIFRASVNRIRAVLFTIPSVHHLFWRCPGKHPLSSWICLTGNIQHVHILNLFSCNLKMETECSSEASGTQ
jgi:hypothetical protein